MATTLKKTTEYLSFSETEAEELIEEAKTNTQGCVIEHNIRRKERKEEVYYIVKIVEELDREKDILDNIG